MYAEINSKLNYTKGVESNWNNNSFKSFGDKPYSTNNGYPRFDNMTQSNNSKQTDESYYCGGQSSLALRGIQMSNTPLSLSFFSNENISRIQRHIKKKIYNDSKGQFNLEVDQDELDLLVVMRSIYLDNAKHLPNCINKQVKELNRLTLQIIVPDMITNIEQQMGYLRDISTPIQPMPLPINVNNAGRRSLPSVTTIWK